MFLFLFFFVSFLLHGVVSLARKVKHGIIINVTKKSCNFRPFSSFVNSPLWKKFFFTFHMFKASHTIKNQHLANASKMKNVIRNGCLSGPNLSISEPNVFKLVNRLPTSRETNAKLKNFDSEAIGTMPAVSS